MHENSTIVIFDGVCNLCNRWVNVIIKNDQEGRFKFASMQSDFAKKRIAEYVPENFNFDSILLFKGSAYYDRSDAVMEIARELSGYRVLFLILRITPKPIRDFFYNVVAKNRYRMFGKRSACMIPTQEIRDRFIEDGSAADAAGV